MYGEQRVERVWDHELCCAVLCVHYRQLHCSKSSTVLQCILCSNLFRYFIIFISQHTTQSIMATTSSANVSSSMRIEEVKSTELLQRIATHTHIKGLGKQIL